jgi:hypothetical protein
VHPTKFKLVDSKGTRLDFAPVKTTWAQPQETGQLLSTLAALGVLHWGREHDFQAIAAATDQKMAGSGLL